MSTNRNFYLNEVQAINAFFKSYQLGFKAKASALTPQTAVYELLKAKGVRFNSINPYIDDLQGKLYGLRSKAGYSDRIQLVVTDQPPALIVPRIDPKPMQWANRPQSSVGQWHTLLGRFYVADKGHALALNLDHPTQFSILLGGTSGCGKSTLLDGMILSACEGSTPDQLKLMFVDIGKKHFGPFYDLPHCNGFASTVPGALALLQHVEASMHGPENHYTERTIVVIDEAQRLTLCGDMATQDEFKRLLTLIASAGRAYGISIVISTQKPMASVIPSAVRDNCVARIAGVCMGKNQSKTILGDGETDAVQLSRPGTFILIDGSQKRHFYSYMIEDTGAEIERIASQWDGYEPEFFDFEADAEESQVQRPPAAAERPAPMPSRKERQTTADAEAIRPLIDDAYDFDSGEVRTGWGVTLIEAIYGESKPNAGNYKARMMDAVNHLLADLTNEPNEPKTPNEMVWMVSDE